MDDWASDDNDDQQSEGAGSVPGHPEDPPPRQQALNIVLPPFWADNAAAWFAHIESRFRLRRVADEWDRFDCVVAALPKDTLRLVLDIVTTPPPVAPYTALKARILHTHERTDYQRIEQLMAMEALGDRRPSELLAAMLEICPAGEEKSKFFAFHFLHRLPQELRIMLGEDDHQEVHQLAAKADKLWAIHGHRLHGSVAAATAPTADLNAVRGSFNKRGAQQRGKGRGRPFQPAQPATAVASSSSPSPASLARSSAGLCYYHWQFGDKASKCDAPCSWQGN